MSLDPRGARFSAGLTTLLLVAVLAMAAGAPVVAGVLALIQAVIFAIGAISARRAPYSLIFKALVAPRLSAPTELEPAGPVRFSQGVGFVFAAAAAAALFAGATVLGVIAASAALVAAFLNAAFGLCLACKVYPFISLYVIRRKAQGAHS